MEFNKEDISWAAGFFDGEGTTSILKAQRDKYSYIRMSVSQKDIWCLEKFLSIVKFGKIYKSKTRDIYSWNCYKTKEVLEILTMMWKFLSPLKRKQAQVAMLRCDLIKESNEKLREYPEDIKDLLDIPYMPISGFGLAAPKLEGTTVCRYCYCRVCICKVPERKNNAIK